MERQGTRRLFRLLRDTLGTIFMEDARMMAHCAVNYDAVQKKLRDDDFDTPTELFEALRRPMLLVLERCVRGSDAPTRSALRSLLDALAYNLEESYSFFVELVDCRWAMDRIFAFGSEAEEVLLKLAVIQTRLECGAYSEVRSFAQDLDSVAGGAAPEHACFARFIREIALELSRPRSMELGVTAQDMPSGDELSQFVEPLRGKADHTHDHWDAMPLDGEQAPDWDLEGSADRFGAFVRDWASEFVEWAGDIPLDDPISAPQLDQLLNDGDVKGWRDALALAKNPNGSTLKRILQIWEAHRAIRGLSWLLPNAASIPAPRLSEAQTASLGTLWMVFLFLQQRARQRKRIEYVEHIQAQAMDQLEALEIQHPLVDEETSVEFIAARWAKACLFDESETHAAFCARMPSVEEALETLRADEAIPDDSLIDPSIPGTHGVAAAASFSVMRDGPSLERRLFMRSASKYARTKEPESRLSNLKAIFPGRGITIDDFCFLRLPEDAVPDEYFWHEGYATRIRLNEAQIELARKEWNACVAWLTEEALRRLRIHYHARPQEWDDVIRERIRSPPPPVIGDTTPRETVRLYCAESEPRLPLSGLSERSRKIYEREMREVERLLTATH